MIGSMNNTINSRQIATNLFQNANCKSSDQNNVKAGKSNPTQDRIAEIKTRIEEIRGSEMDTQQKNALIQTLEQEIQTLQKQSFEENVEKTSETTIKEGIGTKEVAKEVIEGRRTRDLLELSDDYKKLRNNYSVTQRLEGEADTLAAQLKNNSGNAEAKIKKLSEIESRVGDSAKSLSVKLGKVLDKVEEASNNSSYTKVEDEEDSKEDLSVLEKNLEIIKGKEDKELEEY